jgi:hypothetical protein
VKKAERELIMRQQVVLPETPRQRREVAALEEDLKTIPQAGRRLSLRIRNFRSSPEAYLASAGGPLPYMLRLREIERHTAEHLRELRTAWREAAEESGDGARRFDTAWREQAERWSFAEVNDLIDRHNRWYPVESRLPMDPRTGDYALVNGRDYRLDALDARWVLERFPPDLGLARAS